MKTFKWTLEIEVDETWVADGFNLTPQYAQDMMQKVLGWARENEVTATVLKAPPVEAVKIAQGAGKPEDYCTKCEMTKHEPDWACAAGEV